MQGSVRLVAGNTGYGIYKEWLPEDHLIDIKQVPELRRLSLSKVGFPRCARHFGKRISLVGK